MLVRVATLFVLAAGLAAVAAPSGWLEERALTLAGSGSGYLYWFWMLSLGDAAALLGIGIGVALAVGRGRPDAARALALALGFAGLAWGLATGELPGLGLRLRSALVAASGVLMASGLLAFTLRFPRPMGDDELLSFARGSAQLAVSGRDDALARGFSGYFTASRRVERALEAMLQWVLGFGDRARGAGVTARVERWLRIDAHAHGVAAAARNTWPIAGLYAAALVLSIGASLGTPVDFVAMAVTLVVVVSVLSLAAYTAWFAYARADDSARTKALWFVTGFVLLVAIPMVGIIGLMPFGLPDAANGVVATAAWLAFVLCLIPAVFLRGSFGPGLIVRSTVIAASFSLLLAFVFALVEEAVAPWLAQVITLPDAGGFALSGGLAAVVFAPMWRRIDDWVKRQLG